MKSSDDRVNVRPLGRRTRRLDDRCPDTLIGAQIVVIAGLPVEEEESRVIKLAFADQLGVLP
ncbi:MAG TPA: hypothetical protein VGK43_00315, partial [Solirubrobacterales bacterium]